MQTQIRQSAFETNSSSSHSITISENTKTDLVDFSLIPDENGNIVLKGGEFGWEWNRFNDAKTKANYCAIDSEYNQEHRNLLKVVICEQTGAKDVIFDFNTEDYDSYIDHESRGISTEAFSTEENLKKFIFDKNSWLFLGNDNENPPINFYDTDKPIYKVKLKIDETESFICKKSKYFNLENAAKSVISRLMNKSQHLSLSEANSYQYKVDIEKKSVTEKNNEKIVKIAYFEFDETNENFIIYTDLNQYPIIVNSCKELYDLKDKLSYPWNTAYFKQENISDFIENFLVTLNHRYFDHQNKKWIENGKRSIKIKAEMVPVTSEQ